MRTRSQPCSRMSSQRSGVAPELRRVAAWPRTAPVRYADRRCASARADRRAGSLTRSCAEADRSAAWTRRVSRGSARPARFSDEPEPGLHVGDSARSRSRADVVASDGPDLLRLARSASTSPVRRRPLGGGDDRRRSHSHRCQQPTRGLLLDGTPTRVGIAGLRSWSRCPITPFARGSTRGRYRRPCTTGSEPSAAGAAEHESRLMAENCRLASAPRTARIDGAGSIPGVDGGVFASWMARLHRSERRGKGARTRAGHGRHAPSARDRRPRRHGSSRRMLLDRRGATFIREQTSGLDPQPSAAHPTRPCLTNARRELRCRAFVRHEPRRRERMPRSSGAPAARR